MVENYKKSNYNVSQFVKSINDKLVPPIYTHTRKHRDIDKNACMPLKKQ